MPVDNENLFGEYVRSRRESLGKSLRGLAAAVGIAPAYLSDIEKGNRAAPQKHLGALIEHLAIPEGEQNAFFDLAARARDSVSPDLSAYVMKNDYARFALRKARDYNITNEKWQSFIDSMDDEDKA